MKRSRECVRCDRNRGSHQQNPASISEKESICGWSCVILSMMTPEERTHIIRLLEDSKEKYLSSIDDVNQAQWDWKPAPECWSVGETAAHIVQSEAILFRALHRAIQSPRNPDWETKTAGKTD